MTHKKMLVGTSLFEYCHPEDLEAIPEIDEEVVTQIQAAVVSFYGDYDADQAEQAPTQQEQIESAIDNSPEIADIGKPSDRKERMLYRRRTSMTL